MAVLHHLGAAAVDSDGATLSVESVQSHPPEDGSLEGLLSAPAADLYLRLLRAGQIDLDESQGVGLRPKPPIVAELLAAGFASPSRNGGHRLFPVGPATALLRLERETHQHIAERIEAVRRARELLPWMEGLRTASSPADHPLAQVLSGAADVTEAWHDLLLGARRSLRAWFTAPPWPAASVTGRLHSVAPNATLAPEVQASVVYESSILPSNAGGPLRAPVLAGGEARVAPSLPMQMLIADDRSALVNGDPASGQAVLVDSPALVTGLALLFDLIWLRATPLPTGDEPPAGSTPSRLQLETIRLLIAGFKDDAIARAMGISARSVRRHLSALERYLGVQGRIAIAVEAVRRRWLPEFDADVERLTTQASG